jgi:NADH-quinone oxidoreductase subunit A
VPTREPAQRFPVRFYLVAMIFIIFDIEIIFIYPWAVVYRGFTPGSFGLIEMVVFAIAVFVSFVYLISNGALDWGPSGVARTRAEMAAQSGRTAATTVRRVTRPEREPVEVG